MTIKTISTEFKQIEVTRLAQIHTHNATKYQNSEAFNVATDIRMERIIPAELKSPVTLSKVFGVDANADFDTVYNLVAEKLQDPEFQCLI